MFAGAAIDKLVLFGIASPQAVCLWYFSFDMHEWWQTDVLYQTLQRLNVEASKAASAMTETDIAESKKKEFVVAFYANAATSDDMALLKEFTTV